MELEASVQKKPLHKLRNYFLHRKPHIDNDDKDNEYEAQEVDPTTKICNKDIYIVSECQTIVLRNRKVVSGMDNLKYKLLVDKIFLEKRSGSTKLTYTLRRNENNPTLPIDYVKRRLESYGDLELAEWAGQMKNYYSSYSKTMDEYFNTIKSNDPKDTLFLEQMKEKARLAINDIESNFIYTKAIAFCGRNLPFLVSISLHEKFLELAQTSLEKYIEFIKKNGFSSVFISSPLQHWHYTTFMTQMYWKSGPSWRGPRREVTLANNENIKLTIRTEMVMDPVDDGFYLHSFSIMEHSEKVGASSKDHMGVKFIKK